MEIDFSLKLPYNQVFSSLELAVKQQMQDYDVQDIECLKMDISQFQKNVMKLIENFNQNKSVKPSLPNSAENQKQNRIGSYPDSTPVGPSGPQSRNENKGKQSLKRKYDSDSEYNYSENNQSFSNDQHKQPSNQQSAANAKVSEQDQRIIINYFQKHYDPTRRNKMQLVKDCQKYVQCSQNAIYTFVQGVIEDMSKKNPKRFKYDKNSQNPGQRQSPNDKFQETSNESAEENLLDENQENEFDKEDLDEEGINELLRKYDEAPPPSRGLQKENPQKFINRPNKFRDEDYQPNDYKRKNEPQEQYLKNYNSSAQQIKHERPQEALPKIVKFQYNKGQFKDSKDEEPYMKNKMGSHHYNEKREVAYDSDEDNVHQQYQKKYL